MKWSILSKKNNANSTDNATSEESSCDFVALDGSRPVLDGRGIKTMGQFRFILVKVHQLNVFSAVLIGLLVFGISAATSQAFSGVYRGTFSGTYDSGQFAMLVRENSTAYVIWYDGLDEEGDTLSQVTVNPNGSFSFFVPNDTVSGQISGNTVSGTYCCDEPGTFQGTKSTANGQFAASGGRYEGTLSGTWSQGGESGPLSGQISLVIDSAGQGMVYAPADFFLGGTYIETGESGGFINVASNGSVSGTLLDGVSISGFLNTSALTVSGNFSFSAPGQSASGNWTAARVEPLPSSEIDTDGDGVPDSEDACPNDPNESVDTYSDGICNNTDTDDDNDGIPDNVDPYPLGRFSDVSPNHWAVTFIEKLAESGITAGCGNGNYCPNAPVTRAQMAVFLVRGIHGSNFSPPAATGNVFLDVGANDFAAGFIEQFSQDGITSGCGNGNYCPNAEVTRDQMAVFLLRAKHGSGYSPPSASGVFNDVPLNHWAVHWIEQLAAEGITSGCGNNNYCPNAVVTRDQMAVFLVRTFGL
jgi:hypothetical protein